VRANSWARTVGCSQTDQMLARREPLGIQPDQHDCGHVFGRWHPHPPPHPDQLFLGIGRVLGGFVLVTINPRHVVDPGGLRRQIPASSRTPNPVAAQN